MLLKCSASSYWLYKWCLLFKQGVQTDPNPAGLAGRTNKNLHHRHCVAFLQQPGGTVSSVNNNNNIYLFLAKLVNLRTCTAPVQLFFFFLSTCLMIVLLFRLCAGDSEHAGIRQPSQKHHEQT